MKTLLVWMALSLSATGEIVDRVAIAIERQVITESQIDEELRVTALLNHRPIMRDGGTRRDAADRLVQQFLIRRETEVSHYPGPEAADIDAYVARVEKDFGGAAALDRALKAYGLSQDVFHAHLVWLLETMRFIDFRFRPEFSGSDADVERRTDEALSVWLEEARKRFNIVYLDKALQ